MSAKAEYSLEQRLADLAVVKSMTEQHAEQVALLRLSGEGLDQLEDMEDAGAIIRLLHFVASSHIQQSITSVINISAAPKLDVPAIAEALRQARGGEGDG